MGVRAYASIAFCQGLCAINQHHEAVMWTIYKQLNTTAVKQGTAPRNGLKKMHTMANGGPLSLLQASKRVY